MQQQCIYCTQSKPFSPGEEYPDALQRYGVLDRLPVIVLRRIIRVAARLFDAPLVSISLLDRDHIVMLDVAHGTWSRLLLAGTFCEQTLRQNRLLVVPDASRDPRFASHEAVAGSLAWRFYAGTPLRAPDGAPLGTIFLLDRQPHPSLSEEHAQLLQDLAEVVVDELELGRALSRATVAELAAQRQAAELARLEQVLRTLSSSLDPTVVLARFAEQLGQAVDVTSAYISRFDADQERMTVVAEYFSPQANVLERVSDIGVSIHMSTDFPGLAEVLLNGYPNIFSVDDPATHPSIQAYLRLFDAYTMLQIPILIGNEIVAFAWLWESRGARRFSAEEIALAEQVASYGGLALQNARLYENARQELAERRQAEAALRRSESKNRALLEAVPDIMLRLNRDGRYLDVKDDKDGNLLAPPPELIGRTLFEVMPLELARLNHYHIGCALDSGEIQHYEYQLTIKGVVKDFECRVVACGDDEVLAVVREITQRKQLDRELIAAREAALESSRLKSAFLANVSHEIRTPMNGVIGMLDLLRDTPLSVEQQDYLCLASSSGTALMTLLNDILDFSKIEAGKLTLQPAPFDLHAVVAEVVSLFAEQAASANLVLQVNLDQELPQWLYGDALRLRQVLTNLVGNAVKFTPSGRVDLHVGRDRGVVVGEPAEVYVHFSVRDTGIGMAHDQLDQLFQPFSQVDSSTTRRYSGTGLGLAISRQLVEMMGGTISVASMPGLGSTFGFSVPLRQVQLAELVQRDPAWLRLKVLPEPLFPGRRVLVAEDNPVNQKVALHQLERFGVVPVVVANGLLVLDALQQASYDLILMDIQMPELDGFATTAEIRRRERGRRTPIVAVTAHALAGERERCLAADMDDYLAKPISQESIAAILQRWLVEYDALAGTNESPLDGTVLEQLRDLQSEGYPDVLGEIIDLFLEDSPPRLAELRAAAESGEVQVVRETAHSLKGSASNLGAIRLVELCKVLEDQGRSGLLHGALAIVSRLEREYERVRIALLHERRR